MGFVDIVFSLDCQSIHSIFLKNCLFMDCRPWTNNITHFRNVPSCENFYRWSCVREKSSWRGYDRGWEVWLLFSTCYKSYVPVFTGCK